jgi:hypothetical protein
MAEGPSLLSASALRKSQTGRSKETNASSRSRVVTRPRMCGPVLLPQAIDPFCSLQHGQRTNRPLPQTPIMHSLHLAVRVVSPRHGVQTSPCTTTLQADHQMLANIDGSHSLAGVQRSHPKEVVPPNSRRSPPPLRRRPPSSLTGVCALQFRK